MLHPRRVACYTVPRPRTSSASGAQALWITDDVLAEAFQRFVGSRGVRHGSHVPGPLEARRRASKRRHTNLANVGCQAPIDASVLFGKESRVEWWNVGKTARQTGKDVFPFYISVAPGAEPQNAKVSREEQKKSLQLGRSTTHWWMSGVMSTAEEHAAAAQFPTITAQQETSPELTTDTREKLMIKSTISTSESGRELADASNVSSRIQKLPVIQQVATSGAKIFDLSEDVGLQSDKSRIRQPPATESAATATTPGIDSVSRNFKSGLWRCSSVAELHALLDRHKINPQLQHKHMSIILRYVMSDKSASWIKAKWSSRAIAEYVADAKFHPRGCSHYAAIVKKLHSNKSAVQGWLYGAKEKTTVMSAIREAVTEGKVLGPEWLQILNITLTHKARVSGKEYRECQKLSKLLIDCYQHSPGFDNEFLDHTLLKHAAHTSMLKLLCRLQRQRSHPNLPLIASAYTTWFESTQSSEQSSKELTQLARELLFFSAEAQCEIIGRISGPLLAASTTKTTKDSARHDFRAFLVALNDLDPSNSPVRRTDADRIATSIPRQLPELDRLVIFLYILSLRYSTQHRATKQADSLSLLELFHLDRRFHDLSADALHEELIKRARSMLLPGMYVFSEDLVHSLSQHLPLQSARPAKNLANIVHEAAPLLLHDDVNWPAHTSNIEQFEGLVAALNNDMDTLRQLIRSLVASNKLNFRFVTRFLENNPRFRSALARPLDKAPKPSISKLYTSEICPEQAIDTISVLAVSFALSKAISPRRALAMVKWCYDYLIQSAAPVQFPVSRALWHAGVARYGNSCSREQLQWILRQVARVEGREVARGLYLRADYRKMRAETFVKLGALAEHQHLDAKSVVEPAEQLQPVSSATGATESRPAPPDVLQIARSIQDQAIAIAAEERKQMKERRAAQETLEQELGRKCSMELSTGLVNRQSGYSARPMTRSSWSMAAPRDQQQTGLSRPRPVLQTELDSLSKQTQLYGTAASAAKKSEGVLREHQNNHDSQHAQVERQQVDPGKCPSTGADGTVVGAPSIIISTDVPDTDVVEVHRQPFAKIHSIGSSTSQRQQGESDTQATAATAPSAKIEDSETSSREPDPAKASRKKSKEKKAPAAAATTITPAEAEVDETSSDSADSATKKKETGPLTARQEEDHDTTTKELKSKRAFKQALKKTLREAPHYQAWLSRKRQEEAEAEARAEGSGGT